MAERTLIIIKPDAIQRHLLGVIISRFERKGYRLVAAKFMKVSEQLARRLYAIHKGRSFYEGLVKFLTRSPVLVTVWEGEKVISVARRMMGATFGFDAEPGTIRGDLCCTSRFNLVHGSDSAASAEREIGLFFEPDEIIKYSFADEDWLYFRGD